MKSYILIFFSLHEILKNLTGWRLKLKDLDIRKEKSLTLRQNYFETILNYEYYLTKNPFVTLCKGNYMINLISIF